MLTIPRTGAIWIVDDQPANLLIVDMVLAESRLDNPRVQIGGGKDAMTYIDAVASGDLPVPALILLDVNMPVIDGFDVLRHIRAKPCFSRLPVVAMLTSSDAEEDREQAMRLGADHYLSKRTGLADYVRMFDVTFAYAEDCVA